MKFQGVPAYKRGINIQPYKSKRNGNCNHTNLLLQPWHNKLGSISVASAEAIRAISNSTALQIIYDQFDTMMNVSPISCKKH